MSEDSVTLTREMIFAGASRRGGWSIKQLRCLGLSAYEKGWIRRCIGMSIPRRWYEKFLALKDAHLRRHGDPTLFPTGVAPDSQEGRHLRECARP